MSGCIGEKGHIMQKEKEDFLQCTHMIIWCDQLLLFQCWLGFLVLHFCDVVMRARVHGVINRVHHRPLSFLKWLHKPLRDHRTFTWEADCLVFTPNTHAYTHKNSQNVEVKLWQFYYFSLSIQCLAYLGCQGQCNSLNASKHKKSFSPAAALVVWQRYYLQIIPLKTHCCEFRPCMTAVFSGLND